MAVSASHMSLRPRDRVALIVESLAPLPATVAATERAQATLVIGSGSPVPARWLHRRPAAIETALDGRRYRAEGELAMVAGQRGKAREDAIAFHFAGGTPRMRRRDERAPAVLPVTLQPIRAEALPARGLTLNVSAGGALLKGPRELGTGEELLLHLHLPAEDLPIPARGEVVRRTDDGAIGVRLDRMRPADRELVLRWIASQSVR